ncbi:MAG: Isochorismate synthase MenF [Chlamydiae bacterium]|nr:Isochorismate synthase MenF [Chlamydiota bacterium]
MNSFSFESSSQAHLRLLEVAGYFDTFSKISLLFSSDHEKTNSSYLFLAPCDHIEITPNCNQPWKTLKKKLGNFNTSNSPLPEWIGYLSYEMGAYADSNMILPHSKSPFPLAHFDKFAITLLQKDNQITVHIRTIDKIASLPEHTLLKKALNIRFWKSLFSESISFSHASKGDIFEVLQTDTFESYFEKMNRAQEYIRSGDIYEVNLSRSITYGTDIPPFTIFKTLSQINPVSFSAYLNYDSFQVVSASPERFLSKFGDCLEARPIKGTLPRLKNSEQDKAQCEKLIHSSKENAELAMICDLMRNDLGKVCEIGSVRCIHKAKLLTLSNVFHLESVIRGQPIHMHPLDLIQSCFPAGSITGCPKIRSMQIINLLEKRPRHLYCGSVGYFTSQGDFDFSVAIRTGVYQRNQFELQLGGAITIDSDLEDEFEETKAKGSPFEKIFQKKALKQT